MHEVPDFFWKVELREYPIKWWTDKVMPHKYVTSTIRLLQVRGAYGVLVRRSASQVFARGTIRLIKSTWDTTPALEFYIPLARLVTTHLSLYKLLQGFLVPGTRGLVREELKMMNKKAR
jgi:hypothetical protein